MNLYDFFANSPSYILIIYYVLINLTAFYCMYADKQKAINHEYRISEATLFNLAFLGGVIGYFFGMFKFHHKTKKTKFYVYGVIAMFIHLYIIYLLTRGLL